MHAWCVDSHSVQYLHSTSVAGTGDWWLILRPITCLSNCISTLVLVPGTDSYDSHLTLRINCQLMSSVVDGAGKRLFPWFITHVHVDAVQQYHACHTVCARNGHDTTSRVLPGTGGRLSSILDWDWQGNRGTYTSAVAYVIQCIVHSRAWW